MNWLLLANNVTSLIVILICWWLAHQNARAVPPGRAIAAGYALIGFSMAFTMIVRNIGIDPRWFIVGTKALLGATLAFVSYRRARLGDS